MTNPTVYFLAAEPSGDQLARDVIDAIVDHPNAKSVSVVGAGGERMAEIGLSRPVDLSALSILGFVEGIKAYPKVVKAADEVAADILKVAPDAVVLVDSWGFMLRVAQRVRKAAPNIRLIKLVGPQVWATRPGRAKTLSKTVDHLLCIHAMEQAFYTPHGLKTTVIGNPALSRAMPHDAVSFRKRYGLADDRSTILVLPGSRRSEIARVAPDLVETARKLKENDPARQIVFSPSGNVRDLFIEQFQDALECGVVTDSASDRYSSMAAADVALACSGTVSTELAMMGVPMVVAYRTGWITWMLARHVLYKPTCITLLNIANGDSEIIPEFLQNDLNAENIVPVVERWLSNERELSEQRKKQDAGLENMKEGDRSTAEIASDAIFSDLGLA